MNRTQRITADWLKAENLSGDHLMLEALLRRGFLAFMDGQGVFLGSGSHYSDLDVLTLVAGIGVQAIADVPDRIAKISFLEDDQIGAAIQIIQLGENHLQSDGYGGFTGYGLGPYVNSRWTTYRRMKWGAKLAVCPAQSANQVPVSNSLDTGIALLTKAFPLVRVATSLSCDGHGIRYASITFHFPWDAPWSKAVFDVIEETHANSLWKWGESDLRISPTLGYHDAAVMGMLSDIQKVARRFLEADTIQNVDSARVNLMDEFQNLKHVNLKSFATKAERHLRAAFANVNG